MNRAHSMEEHFNNLHSQWTSRLQSKQNILIRPLLKHRGAQFHMPTQHAFCKLQNPIAGPPGHQLFSFITRTNHWNLPTYIGRQADWETHLFKPSGRNFKSIISKPTKQSVVSQLLPPLKVAGRTPIQVNPLKLLLWPEPGQFR